jgi:hypothetical protein
MGDPRRYRSVRLSCTIYRHPAPIPAGQWVCAAMRLKRAPVAAGEPNSISRARLPQH